MNPTDGIEHEGLKRSSVGSIQVTVEKRSDIKEHGIFVSGDVAGDTSATKIWKRDKKIAGKVSMATRYLMNITTAFKLRRHAADFQEFYWSDLQTAR